jgi:putative membrane protein
MTHPYWNDWYLGWGWFLWFGIWFLLISNVGHWGYSYRKHQSSALPSNKSALDLLKERYALGELSHEEFISMKREILAK